MLIPWNTDAPLYHRPWCTGAMIVANILAFIAVGADPDFMESWALQYGDGFHPLQWLTSNFLHNGVIHLIGNMVFLWSFGLVVEGKTGWLGFLAIYLGIGVSECALEQAATMSLEGVSFGSSSIIYGLLAICVLWAPRNDFQCLLLVGLRPWLFDVPILAFGALYIGWEVLWAWLQGLTPSSAMLHTAGALVGFVLGMVLLKLRWVDCEGWDLYTLTFGQSGARKVRRKTLVEDAPEPAINVADVKVRFKKAIDDRNGNEAMVLYSQLVKARRKWQATEQELLGLLKALHAQKSWIDSIPFSVEFLKRFPENGACSRLRLKLAQIMLEQNRPAQALKVLGGLKAEVLPSDQEDFRRKLIAQAQRKQQQGVIELATEDW